MENPSGRNLMKKWQQLYSFFKVIDYFLENICES